MEKIEKLWNSLSEWVRWIICWPVVFGGALICWFIGSHIVPFSGPPRFLENGAPASIGDLIIGILAQGFYATGFFFLITTTVPRGQDITAAIITTFYTVVNMLAIAGVIMSYNEGEIPIFTALMSVIYIAVTIASYIGGAIAVRQYKMGRL